MFVTFLFSASISHILLLIYTIHFIYCINANQSIQVNLAILVFIPLSPFFLYNDSATFNTTRDGFVTLGLYTHPSPLAWVYGLKSFSILVAPSFSLEKIFALQPLFISFPPRK